MGSVADNLNNVIQLLPQEVTLVAVSKTKSEEMIMDAYNVGQRDFGENKVQDLVQKYEHLPKDIKWHFIGHLQTNKVKYIAPFIHLLHGVDTEKLLVQIDKEGIKNSRSINCLLQVHIAQEETKFGFSDEELIAFLESDRWKQLTHVNIVGLMAMASHTSDLVQIADEFRSVSDLFFKVKQCYFQENKIFTVLSMGMSGDYMLAVANGSNMIRVGSSIFGDRIY